MISVTTPKIADDIFEDDSQEDPSEFRSSTPDVPAGEAAPLPPERQGRSEATTAVPFSPSSASSKLKSLIADLCRHRDQDELHFAIASTSGSVIKSVVFSQWTSVLNLIEPHLKQHRIGYTRLDGSMTVQKRNEHLVSFRTSPSVRVLLVSLKAGGTGLDLSCACRVYLLDPWWNPSIEQQAIDRIYRLGQTRPVVTVRMVIKGSVEENIIALQEKKAQLAKETLMDKDEGRSRSRQKERDRNRRLADLRDLFRMGPNHQQKALIPNSLLKPKPQQQLGPAPQGNSNLEKTEVIYLDE